DEDDEAVFNESAIDDDDESSEWEDSNKESVDSKLDFKRIDSTTNLTSRRSLITLALTQSARLQRSRGVSQSTSALPRAHTSPNGLHGSPNDSDSPLISRTPPMKPISEIPRSSVMPIMTTINGIADQAMSPRTARRTMLSTELTESLRHHILWER
ncbi:hypothetical protein GE09DRAFT_929732, partial [Coniochaeta sp. 2T2.1]